MDQRCNAFRELCEQPSMHRFRRRSTKSLLCMVALTMPLQVSQARPCGCAQSHTSSVQTPLMFDAMQQRSCCSAEPACCSATADAGVSQGCCRGGQVTNSSSCDCGPGCHCSLQAPTPDTPALPPVSSTELGEEIPKSQAVSSHVVDTLLPATAPALCHSSQMTCMALTKLDLCATFCRFLL